MALRAPPAACMSLLPLPQRRCTFVAALPEGCIARLWRASTAAPHAVVSSSAALYSVFTSLLLSTLDSRHHPIIAPQPPTVAIVRWHAFIALGCLSSAAIVLRHILPKLLICQHGFGIWHSSIAMSNIRSSAATKSLLLHRHPLLTATVIVRCAVASLLLLRRLIVASWLSFHRCSCWHHRVGPPSAALLPCLRITANFFRRLVVVF